MDGFQDLCIANVIIDRKQCTIGWYVDDNKISLIDGKVINRVIKKLRIGLERCPNGEEKSTSFWAWISFSMTRS